MGQNQLYIRKRVRGHWNSIPKHSIGHSCSTNKKKDACKAHKFVGGWNLEIKPTSWTPKPKYERWFWEPWIFKPCATLL